MKRSLIFSLVIFVWVGLLTTGCEGAKTATSQPASATLDLAGTESARKQATTQAGQTQSAIDQATESARQSATSQAATPTSTPEPSPTPSPTSTPEPTPAPFQASLAEYGLEDALVPLVLSPQQLSRLAESGVVASPQEYPEFHNLYLRTSIANLPVFVTSDSLLHIYHLTFDEMLSSLEEYVFLPQLKQLNQMLIAQAEAQYQQLTGTKWEEAAQRVLAYLSVGTKLADPNYAIPSAVKDLVDAELKLIYAAGGRAPSPIFPLLKYGEDYTQYVPRGHYTENNWLKVYFRAMMWYGRMTFRLGDSENPEVGPAETRMALLLTLAVRNGRDGQVTALKLWENLYDPTAFLVGRSDDLTIQQYLSTMSQVYGSQTDMLRIADDTRLEAFISAANELPAPLILGLVSDDYKPLEAVKGLRLMGQRFVPDAYIFQQLIYPKVPERYLPSGLDVMAVMGSARAALWLASDPTTQNPEYAAESGKLVEWLAGLSPADWTETTYNSLLYTLQALLTPAGENTPLFMQSTAWLDKQLNTALGSWAELKHDTLLYAKQVYGGLGGCGYPRPPAPVLALNYVEPVPEVFGRLAALISLTRKDLEQRGLLQLVPKEDQFQPSLGDRLASLETTALAFKTMAEKELRGQPLSQAEQSTLRSYGEYIEEIVLWVNGKKPEPDPAAIIADVATDPNTGQVLEVGTGRVHEVYVLAPIPQANGSQLLTAARGGIFSYYEFPSMVRLTDGEWRNLLKNEQAPEQPSFTSGFSVPEAASLDIQAVIYSFQRNWANWMYLTSGYVGEGAECPATPRFEVPVSDEVRQQAKAAIEELKAQNQYEGRQWLSSVYLSAIQAEDMPDRLLVTVRESWKDYLVSYEGSDPFAWFKQGKAESIRAWRGPYTVDVLYTLEREPFTCDTQLYSCYQWRVVGYTELTSRPEW